MNKLDLLRTMTFGTQVAEEETNDLASYFVETTQWSRISSGLIDFVRGEKGSGKSAIYSLLMQRSNEMSERRLLLVAAENPRGQTVFRDLGTHPPTTETEFVVLWKLYIAAIVAREMRNRDFNGPSATKVYAALEDARLLSREFSLAGILRTARDYAKRLLNAESYEAGLKVDPTTMAPTVTGKIVLREPGSDLRTSGVMSVDNLLSELNSAAGERNFKVWALFDRLDVAFAEDHQLEANAIRALIRVYSDIRGHDNLSLKIFLREDIWKRITIGGFREATHVVKFTLLEWTEPSLLNLIMKRLLNNDVLVRELKINRAEVLKDRDKQEALFSRLFPAQVDQGARKPKTFKWLVSRCRDGTGRTAPREIILMLNSVIEEEIKRLEHGEVPPPNEQLFDSSVFKSALPTVSNYRLHQYLYAEYPADRPYLEKLRGEKAEQDANSLAVIWRTTPEKAAERAGALVDIGFFEKRGTRENQTFWVPFLYRDSLELVQGRADDED